MVSSKFWAACRAIVWFCIFVCRPQKRSQVRTEKWKIRRTNFCSCWDEPLPVCSVRLNSLLCWWTLEDPSWRWSEELLPLSLLGRRTGRSQKRHWFWGDGEKRSPVNRFEKLLISELSVCQQRDSSKVNLTSLSNWISPPPVDLFVRRPHLAFRSSWLAWRTRRWKRRSPGTWCTETRSDSWRSTSNRCRYREF